LTARVDDYQTVRMISLTSLIGKTVTVSTLQLTSSENELDPKNL